MKIVKASNGKTRITLSKKEWQEIGKTAGWMDDIMEEEGYDEEEHFFSNSDSLMFMGKKLEYGYDEYNGRWECFVEGIGTSYDQESKEKAISKMKDEILKESTNRIANKI